MNTEDIVILAQNGDKNSLNNLIISFEPLIKNIVNSKSKNVLGFDMEDAMQEGRVGFLKAINSFDKNRNAKFSTFAKKVVENEILSYIRNVTSKTNSLNIYGVSLDNIDENMEDTSFQAIDEKSPETKILEEEQLNKLLSDIKENLSDLENTILNLKLDGFSYAEIASYVNKTQKSIDNAMSRIKTKLTTKRGK